MLGGKTKEKSTNGNIDNWDSKSAYKNNIKTNGKNSERKTKMNKLKSKTKNKNKSIKMLSARNIKIIIVEESYKVVVAVAVVTLRSK